MEDLKEEPIRQMHYRVCHITPIVCTLINFYMTDVVMKKSHWWLPLPFLVYYNVLYFIFVKISGTVPYWFADWKDYKTPIFCLLCASLLVGEQLLFTSITIRIKRGNSSNKK